MKKAVNSIANLKAFVKKNQERVLDCKLSVERTKKELVFLKNQEKPELQADIIALETDLKLLMTKIAVLTEESKALSKLAA